MSIIHVQQIKSQLVSLFDRLVDVSDYQSRPPLEQESAFLTRSLAAFALMTAADVKPDKAASCVTDGGQDNGIDAIYYDDFEKVLYLVQAKWKHDGRGSIERGDAQKFIQGINDIVNVRFERFNDRIRNRATEITTALFSANTRIVILLAYTGQDPLAEEVERDFNDLLREMNDPSDVVQLRVLRQGNLHSVIASGTLGAPINFDVVLHNWGQIREPYQAYFGHVSVSEVAAWWDKHHPRLFSPNLRVFLGMTEINQGIVETIENNPENFWYFNNGITALCSSVQKKPIGGNTHDSGVFECVDVRIVNGAQTVGAIALAHSKHPEKSASASVMVRFISLEKCPDGFGLQVTRATNTQNRIERRDFVSLDPEQERLRTELQLEGVDYCYKAGDSPRNKESGFDLTEATVALACAHPEISYAMQAKREISKLWDEITKAPYKALFNSSLSSLRLWRLVRIHRAADAELKTQQDSRAGRAAMIPVHGNRFIARQVFQHLDLQGLDNPDTDVGAVLSSVPDMTAYAVELTVAATNELYPDSYVASTFKNIGKCRTLEDTIDRKWKKEKVAESGLLFDGAPA